MKLLKIKKLVTVAFFLIAATSVTFAFWNATPNAPETEDTNTDINIGADGTFNTVISEFTLTNNTTGVLVPQEVEANLEPNGETWITSIEFTFNINWQTEDDAPEWLEQLGGEGTLNVSIGDVTIDVNTDVSRFFNFDFSATAGIQSTFTSPITVNEAATPVTLTVTMNLPTSEADLNIILGAVVNFQVIASVSVEV